MHQDADIWSQDANEFRPERWEKLKVTWDYIPFSGGPRICPAQQLVLTESAYVVHRLVQGFSSIESRDQEPWTAQRKLTMMSKYGVKVAMTPIETFRLAQ